MRIAQVCPFFFPVDGGVEKHVLRLSLGLIKRGHEVDVYTSASTRNHRTLARVSQAGDLNIRRFKPLLGLGEFGALWPGFAPELLASGYDIVHSHAYRHPHSDISAFVAKAMGARSVLTGHSPFHPDKVRSSMASGLTSIYDGLIAPLTLRTFDRIISLTKAEAGSMVSRGAPRNRIVVIPNGVEDENFELVPTAGFTSKYGLDGGKFVLVLGRVNRTKGIDVLLRAFQKVALEVQGVKLVIAGPSASPQELEYRDFLVSLVERLGLSSRVVFTGRLTEEEKLAALQSCSIFVLPSLYEPFGIVLLEAAAHEKPIVSTASDGPSSILRSGMNGLLVNPGNVGALQDSLLSLLGDEALMRRLGRNGRVMAEGFRWRVIVEDVEALYKELLALR